MNSDLQTHCLIRRPYRILSLFLRLCHYYFHFPAPFSFPNLLLYTLPEKQFSRWDFARPCMHLHKIRFPPNLLCSLVYFIGFIPNPFIVCELSSTEKTLSYSNSSLSQFASYWCLKDLSLIFSLNASPMCIQFCISVHSDSHPSLPQPPASEVYFQLTHLFQHPVLQRYHYLAYDHRHLALTFLILLNISFSL